MDTAQIVGIFAAVSTTVAFLPQAVRTIRTRDTAGISLWMYVIFCVGVLGWLIYGLLRHDLPVFVANAVTLPIAGIVLVFKIRGG